MWPCCFLCDSLFIIQDYHSSQNKDKVVCQDLLIVLKSYLNICVLNVIPLCVYGWRKLLKPIGYDKHKSHRTAYIDTHILSLALQICVHVLFVGNFSVVCLWRTFSSFLWQHLWRKKCRNLESKLGFLSLDIPYGGDHLQAIDSECIICNVSRTTLFES